MNRAIFGCVLKNDCLHPCSSPSGVCRSLALRVREANTVHIADHALLAHTLGERARHKPSSRKPWVCA